MIFSPSRLPVDISEADPATTAEGGVNGWDEALREAKAEGEVLVVKVTFPISVSRSKCSSSGTMSKIPISMPASEHSPLHEDSLL